QVEELEHIGLQKIQEAANSGELLMNPQLPATLSLWRDWAGDEESRSWAQNIVTDAWGLLLFLERFLGQSMVQSSGDVAARRKYVLDPQSLAPYLDPQDIAARLMTIDDIQQLPERQQLAVVQFLRGYQLRQQGKDPSNLTSWDDDE